MYPECKRIKIYIYINGVVLTDLVLIHLITVNMFRLLSYYLRLKLMTFVRQLQRNKKKIDGRISCDRQYTWIVSKQITCTIHV